jgi:hypothetical protein
MSEFSREIGLEGLTFNAKEFEFEASDDECRALAERFGILAIHSIKVTGALGRVPGSGDIELCGHVQAVLEQNCSITLGPIEEEVETSFEIRFSDQINHDRPLGEADEWLEDCSFEPKPVGPVDVGEIAAQYLSMAMSPFPRTPGATLDISALKGVDIISEEAARETRLPFSQLKKIKDGG